MSHKIKVLLVDDDPTVRISLCKILEHHGFEVTTADSVLQALNRINSENYDVLLSDLHMPGAGDGLTVVSAMRHANPNAVTLLLSGFPQMSAAADAIVLQTDEILVKPMNVLALVEVINQRLKAGPSSKAKRTVESVAKIMQRTSQETIANWCRDVEKEPKITAVAMSCEERSRHLPQVFRDLVSRLTLYHPLGTKEITSKEAAQHGIDRRLQGYSAAMMVEESRLLQVCIFETLQNNLATIDFSVLLLGVMTIADEVDSQLSQAMECYIMESDRMARAV